MLASVFSHSNTSRYGDVIQWDHAGNAHYGELANGIPDDWQEQRKAFGMV